jgi:hypothetical protein
VGRNLITVLIVILIIGIVFGATLLIQVMCQNVKFVMNLEGYLVNETSQLKKKNQLVLGKITVSVADE